MLLIMLPTRGDSAMLRKMISDALLFPSPLQAYFPLIRHCNGALAGEKCPLTERVCRMNTRIDVEEHLEMDSLIRICRNFRAVDTTPVRKYTWGILSPVHQRDKDNHCYLCFHFLSQVLRFRRFVWMGPDCVYQPVLPAPLPSVRPAIRFLSVFIATTFVLLLICR